LLLNPYHIIHVFIYLFLKLHALMSEDGKR